LKAAASHPDFRGRALLDGVSALLPVPAERLLSLRAAFPGVVLPTPDGQGNLGVLVECWQVHDGQPEVAGMVQHTLSESVGATGAAVLSSVAHAALAVRGAGRDARIGGLLARSLSEGISRIAGSYSEVLIAVPGALLGEHTYSLVVSMHTDSLFARVVDRGLSYGFRKRRAAFVVRSGSLSAYAPDYRTVLALRTQAVEQEAAAGAWEVLQDVHALPLLGYLGGGRYASSRLVRYTYQGSARSEPTKLWIEFGEAGLGPLSGEVFTVPACSARSAYGALAYADVLARIGPAERAPSAAEH
jgi:hypothetical protein